MKMAKPPSPVTIAWWLFFFMAIISQPSSARTLGNPTPSHHHHHRITFLMQDVLNMTHPSSKPAATTKVTSHQLPFPKPLGLFPPNGGIPIPESDTNIPVTGLSTQTFDMSNTGLYFPARATLQELDFGAVTTIDEDLLFEGTMGYGSTVLLVGKAQGVYVATNSKNETKHMMAMTAFFAKNKFKDGLRFFGVHRMDVDESHISVIGGIGKYNGANGYATVKAVDAKTKSSDTGEDQGGNKLLLFTVYLS